MKHFYSLLLFLITLFLLAGPVSAQEFQIISVSSESTTCFDNDEGAITVRVTGGSPDYRYGWFRTNDFVSGNAFSPDTEHTFTGLPRGNYIIYASYASSEEDPLQSVVSVSSPPILFAGITPDPAQTCELTGLQLNGNPSGGTGIYLHEWSGPGAAYLSSTGVSDPVFTSPGTGIIPVNYKVTDDNGCEAETMIQVTVYPALSAVAAVTEDVLCFGGNDGEITVSAPSGGSGNYEYSISGSPWQPGPVFQGLTAGFYDVYMRDASVDVCITTLALALEVGQPDEPLSGTASDIGNVSCFGGGDGSVTVDGNGGTAPYGYSLDGSPPSASGTFESLPAGNFTITITDANGCTFDVPVTISQPAEALGGTVTEILSVSCFGGSNGSVTIGGNGGTAPYNYSLDGGSLMGSGVFGGLAAGDYTVTVSDANGCTFDVPVTVSEPSEATGGTVTEQQDVLCFGGDDGSVTVTGNGGTAPYRYSLDGGTLMDSGLFEGLSAGSYTVTVVDINDCSFDVPVTISQPLTAPGGTLTNLEDVTCFGGDDGSVTVTGNSGTAPYRYSLDGGAPEVSGTFTGLQSGDYTVTVTDDNGCTFDVPVTVSQPDEFIITAGHTGISCYNASDGEIVISAAGGTGPYEYSVYGDEDVSYQSASTFSGLGQDTYNVVARDAGMCLSNELVIIIEEPAQLFVGFNSPAIETCFGDPGTITLTASGGSGNYEYSISTTQYVPGDFQVSSVFNNLSGDVAYYAFVRDTQTGCLVNVNAGNSITIDQPTEIVYSVTTVQDVTGCSYSTNGMIRVSLPSGGSSPYRYLIDGVNNESRTFSNLGTGEYLIEVEDNKGCRQPVVVTLSGPDPVVEDNVVLTNVTGCHGNANGGIAVEASGGTGALEYSVNGIDFFATGDFTGLTAGDHTVTVLDGAGCEYTFTYTLTEPDELAPPETEVFPATCAGSGNTVIRARATGGSAPFTLTLYLGGVVQDFFTGLDEGEWVEFVSLAENMTDYEVMVVDGGGCGPVGSGFLSTAGPEELVLESLTVTDNICFGTALGSIRIEARGGTAPYLYTLYDDGGNQADQIIQNGAATFEDLPAGTYTVTVDDSNGCGPLTNADIVIDQPQELVFDSRVITQITCHGAGDGAVVVMASGGTGDLEYSTDGGETFFPSGNFTDLQPGIYELVVRDNAECLLTDIITIVQPEQLIFGLVQVNDIITGSGNLTGSILVEMNGGVEPYSYSTDDGNTWQDENYFGDLAEGEYTVLVSDANGCSTDTTVMISGVTGIDVSVLPIPPTCYGYEDGNIIITASLGTEPYEYSVDGGLNFVSGAFFTGMSAGTYAVVVRDAAGLTYSEDIYLPDPDPIDATANVTRAWCSSFSPDGSVVLNVTGGTGSYSYIWSDGSNTRDITGLPAGEYSVEITDENGCTTSLQAMVGYEHMVEVTLPGQLTICEGESVELIPELVQSGTQATWSWLASAGPDPDPVTSPVVSPLAPTYYSLRVTDENNCYDEAEVLVDHHPLQGVFIGNDTVIFQGSSITLEARGGEFVSYQWAPGTGLSSMDGPVTTATVTGFTEYFVYAETAEGCIESDSINIDVVKPVSPVSGFTPNGDGVNDFFDIVNAQDYPDIVVEVFNRAGQRVFYSKGYSDDRRWDGTYNGRELPMGTYYFAVTLNDPFSTGPVTGPVTIVR